MRAQNKYRSFPVIKLENRMWPDNKIVKAPIWCSVDLRDGNQALAQPMTVSKKMEMFDLLVDCGLKEIEVGFPSASSTEFKFIRRLIDEKRIPEDVTIQVLVPAREDLIKTTIESLVGAKRVIIHLYNSTSPAQRQFVFGLEKPEIIALARQGAIWVKKYSKNLLGTEVFFEYSPESFSATEVTFAVEVCEAVIKVLKPKPEHKLIINLPETVEVAMPNIYADQVEWFCRNISCRESLIISVHTHNDRGTGVASTELGLLAGADRVEGTLFGNGERTGNLDLITVALNLFTQGINPELDFSNIEHVREIYERCTKMTVPCRHPYSGELVFTAFSGTHQDAIKKGLEARKNLLLGGSSEVVWDIPYLPIDPTDIGREYTEVIRVNSQSGKGGVAYLLENECSIYLPKEMQREFGLISGKLIDTLGHEVTSVDLKSMFWKEYVECTGHYVLKDFSSTNDANGCQCNATVIFNDQELFLNSKGNGPIDAFIISLCNTNNIKVKVIDQHEHALGEGSEASAISYIQLLFPDGEKLWGVGVDESIELASIKAIISGLNRSKE